MDRDVEIRIEHDYEKAAPDVENLNIVLDNLDIDKHMGSNHNSLERRHSINQNEKHYNEKNKHNHVILNQHYSTENNIIPAEKSPTERISRTPSNLTEQGFLDLKFYHSRLW